MPPFRYILPCLLMALYSWSSIAYTHQDTLRGSNGRGRAWWDVRHYDLKLQIDTSRRNISGQLEMEFQITGTPTDSLQLDLQDSLTIDKIVLVTRHPYASASVTPPIKSIYKEKSVWWLKYPFEYLERNSSNYSLIIDYHGRPLTAVNPPWDGGFIWTKDSTGKPWMAVACQGLGASSWWPCKDYQGDEPDDGMSMTFTTPAGGDIVGNGRVHDAEDPGNTLTQDSSRWITRQYFVRNPINSYDATFYIGNYAHWHDTLHGEKGILDLDFYPLKYNEARAHQHWAVTKDMLHCYEYWLGPYPFYEDGYKLVEAPYLGMEHQSAIAYGNQYKMGYLGHDHSGTGAGMSFDYIIIHESGHEWFGNSITAQDPADNWIHEGFTTYLESLFVEWIKGQETGMRYSMGSWNNISNDAPIIGDYGVNAEGSGDRYEKGAAVVFMIRMMINNDSVFRQLLRGLNHDFYHKIVTSRETEDYISRFTGRDLHTFFDVYLRGVNIPVLHHEINGRTLAFTWTNVPAGFNAPVSLSFDGGKHYEVYSGTPYAVQDISRRKRRRLRIKPLGLYTVE